MATPRKLSIVAPSLPNIPWQDCPVDVREPIWRYQHNPVIPRDLIPCANSIFNSAVVPYKGKFAGVFRIDDRRRIQRLHAGRSEDGITWQIEPEPIKLTPANKKTGEIMSAGGDALGYDPRVVWIDDRYWVTWCNNNHGPTIGIAWTRDFKTFTQIDNAFVPFNRNGVLFPRKINGKYVMLNRPSDNGHTPFGDIFLSESPDMIHWGCHRHVMKSEGGWCYTKIGAGPIPIETSEGWLMIYHGVLTSCNGFVYSFSAALLDRDEPWKVIARPEEYLLSPQTLYECVGDVPNVAFPCAALVDKDTGRLALYYGGADTVTCLAFGYVQDIVNFCRKG